MHLISKRSIDNDTKNFKVDDHLLSSDGLECGASEEVITTSPSVTKITLLQPVLKRDVNSSLVYLAVPRKYFCNEWLKDPELKLNKKLVVLHNFINSHLPQNYALEEPVAKLICQLSNQLSKSWNMSPKKKDLFLAQIVDWLNQPPINFKLREVQHEKTTKLKHQPKIQTTDNAEHSYGLNTKSSPKPTPQITVIAKQVPEVKIKLEKYSDILDLLKKSKPSFQPDVLIHILTTGNDCKDLNEENKDTIVKFANRVVTDMRFKWLTANGQDKLFEEKFGYWLQLNIKWPECLKPIIIERNAKYDADVKASLTSKSHKQSYLEKTLTDKLSEVGCKDISEVIHRLVNHPEEAARIKEFVTKSKCTCNQNNTEVDDDVEIKSERSSLDKDDPLRLPEIDTSLTSVKRPPRTYSNPSNAQRLMLRGVLDRLKVTNSTTKPSHKRKVKSVNEVKDNDEEEESCAEDADGDDNDEDEELYEVETLDQEGVCEDESLDQEEVCEDESLDQEEAWEVESLDQEVSEDEEEVDQDEAYEEEQTAEAKNKVEEETSPSPRKSHKVKTGLKLKPAFIVGPGKKLQSLDFGPVLDRALFVSSATIGPDILKNTKGNKTVTVNNNISGTIHKISNLKNAVAVIPVTNNKKGMKVLPRQRRMIRSGPMIATPTKTMVKPININSITNMQQAINTKYRLPVSKLMPTIKSGSVIHAPSNINSRFKVLTSLSNTSTVSATPTNLGSRSSVQRTPNIKTVSTVLDTHKNSQQRVVATYGSKSSPRRVISTNSLLDSNYTALKVTGDAERTGNRPTILGKNVKFIPKSSPLLTVTRTIRPGAHATLKKSTSEVKNTSLGANIALLDDVNRRPLKSRAAKKSNDDEPPSKKVLLESLLNEEF